MEKLRKILELHFDTTEYKLDKPLREFDTRYKFNKTILNEHGFIIQPTMIIHKDCKTGINEYEKDGSTLYIKLESIRNLQRWVPMNDLTLIGIITSFLKERLPEMEINRYQVMGFCSVEYQGNL